MEILILPAIAIFVVLFALPIVLKRLSLLPEAKSKPLYRYTKRPFVMTPAERTCYQALVGAVGERYRIFSQVHLSTILDERIKGQLWKAALNHINRKSVDFVLCNKESLAPLLAIELDDWSHAREDRKERDREVERILTDSGLPLLRITNLEGLSEKISEKLSLTEARP